MVKGISLALMEGKQRMAGSQHPEPFFSEERHTVLRLKRLLRLLALLR